MDLGIWGLDVLDVGVAGIEARSCIGDLTRTHITDLDLIHTQSLKVSERKPVHCQQAVHCGVLHRSLDYDPYSP